MNKEVVEYLQKNKNSFLKEQLVLELKGAGYPEDDIADGLRTVYGGAEKKDAGKVDFWDFKTFRSYSTTSEKIKDFCLGFFGYWVVGILFCLAPIVGPIIFFVLSILTAVRLFKIRKFVSIGIISNFIIDSIVLVIIIATMFLYSGIF